MALLAGLSVSAFVLALAPPQQEPSQRELPRLVSLGGPVTETLFALGYGDAVVAVDDYSNWPAAAAELPKLGYERALSAEGVLSVRPGLVFASAEAGPPPMLDSLVRAGVQLVRLPEARDFATARARIELVAETLHAQDAARVLLANFDAQREQLAERAHATVPARVVYLYASGRAALHVAGGDTPVNVLLRAVGATNALDALRGHAALSPEALVAAEPDVLIIPRASLKLVGGLDALLTHPALKATPAGRARHVFVVDHQAFTGFGPRTPDTLLQLSDELRRWFPTASESERRAR